MLYSRFGGMATDRSYGAYHKYFNLRETKWERLGADLHNRGLRNLFSYKNVTVIK